MAQKSSVTNRPTHTGPEHKIGPFAGGIGIAIWRNSIDTENGRKHFRSITIAPRRYLDKESGEWRDASSFNPSDLPALIFALEKAQEYVFTTPLPGQESTVVDPDSGESSPF